MAGHSAKCSAGMIRWLACLGALIALAPPASADPVSSDSIRAARLVSAFGTISSIYRTIAHNRAVGGVPDSYHLTGRAIDVVRRPGVTHRMIDAALRAAGFSLIESLDEHNHSHFAFGPTSQTSRTRAVPVAPELPPAPRVAADEHGTLWLDLKAQTHPSADPHGR